MVVLELLRWKVPPKMIVVVLLLLWHPKISTHQDRI